MADADQQRAADAEREVRRWRRRAMQAEAVLESLRELLRQAGRLCPTCERWHKDECWRLCPIDGACWDKVDCHGMATQVQRLSVIYECGHTFDSHLPGADEHHARLRTFHA
ncbi:hypothetical protein ACFYUV_38205 [Nonomuraea sp. NPDC003560]|uniref:hypothetical protein n=1 Tax=Nonomuraea sp. NPDC003560 TaxID=3364341 RepID=UPI0036A0CB51